LGLQWMGQLLVEAMSLPICLTMWDHFVDNESAMISNLIKSKPIIGARLKVVSHNCMISDEIISTCTWWSYLIK
jgi:hypothetical protein